MLCGYGLARCLMEPEAAADDPGAELARTGDRQPAPRFPLRYRGAFQRDFASRHDLGAEPGALSQPARDMLEIKLGPEAAARLIACVERMAAAAASIDSDRGNDAEDTAYGRRATPQ